MQISGIPSLSIYQLSYTVKQQTGKFILKHTYDTHIIYTNYCTSLKSSNRYPSAKMFKRQIKNLCFVAISLQPLSLTCRN